MLVDVRTLVPFLTKSWRPDAVLDVSAWADAYQIIPGRSGAEAGRFRTARTPYLREIQDNLSITSPVHTTILQKAAQLGGTQVGLNWTGYIIDHSPGSLLIVQPTVDNAKQFSRHRIEPMLEATARLRRLVAPARSRDSGNTVLTKLFPLGMMILRGANSAAGLRSMPIKYAILDEIDEYPQNVDDQGSPLKLVEARQRTFAERKKFILSTPTIAGYSAIEKLYLKTDQRRYFVPCPHCDHMQYLEFPRLIWSKLHRKPEEAVYCCAGCEQPIEEWHKTRMLEAGEWRPTVEGTDPKVRGYWINGLYNPAGWLSWGDMARQWVDSQSNLVELRTYKNTILAETWQLEGVGTPWETLMTRPRTYSVGQCPPGVLVITAGVDVQKIKLVVEVVGWAAGGTSWSIEWTEFPGDTSDLGPEGPWAELARFMRKGYLRPGGGDGMQIRRIAIDTGYNTSAVYQFVRAHLPQAMAIKGSPISRICGDPTVLDISDRGRKIKVRAVQVWPVGDAITKEELYGNLRRQDPADPGYCHFPAEYGPEYFKGITAEELLEHISRAHRNAPPRQEWAVIPGRENHLLDARRYARAAAYQLGLDRLKAPERPEPDVYDDEVPE